jgi:hypothetical protein
MEVYMFANNIGLKSRFFTIVIASVAILANGSVANAQAPDTASNDFSKVKEHAQARQMVQEILNHWDFKTWDQLLANDVVLNIRLGTATKDTSGDPALLGMKAEFRGRDAAKKTLREIYGDLRKDFQITTEIAQGPKVALLGELVVTAKGKEPTSLPIAVFMAFNEAGKIERMGIFSVDVRALTGALQTATAARQTDATK